MNDLVVCGGSGNKKLLHDIIYELDLISRNHISIDIEVNKFQNENILVQLKRSVRGKDVYYIQSPSTPVHDNIFEMLATVNAMKLANAKRITVITPYFPYSRSDKKDQSRICITGKLMADLLETAGANRIITMELHAEQILGFFNIPADQLYAYKLFAEFLFHKKEYYNELHDFMFVAPDIGAVKKVSKYSELFSVPTAIIDKHRNGNTDTTTPFALIGNVENKICMIIDDEISTGSTLCKAADFLIKNGAKRVEAFVTHPVLCGNALHNVNNSALDKLIVCDTMPLYDKLDQCKKIEVISTGRLFATAIKESHNNGSLSYLFEV